LLSIHGLGLGHLYAQNARQTRCQAAAAPRPRRLHLHYAARGHPRCVPPSACGELGRCATTANTRTRTKGGPVRSSRSQQPAQSGHRNPDINRSRPRPALAASARSFRRNQRNLGFESLKKALTKLPVQTAIIDGEIVCLDAQGVSRFNELFTRKGQSVLYAFDLLCKCEKELPRPMAGSHAAKASTSQTQTVAVHIEHFSFEEFPGVELNGPPSAVAKLISCRTLVK